jgi:methyl-accepting chemotaxis protein
LEHSSGTGIKSIFGLLVGKVGSVLQKADNFTFISLRTKVPLFVGTVSLFSSIGLALSSYQIGLNAIKLSEEQEQSSVLNLIQSSLQEANKKALARADLISRLPFVEKNLREKSRDELLNNIKPALKAQKERFSVTEAQFHLPPAKSYLRVFKPKAPQEDLSSFRQMILRVNREKVPLSGIEIGRRGIGVRGVVPISDKQGHIGSFEIAMDFKPILDTLKKTTGYESGVFVDENRMSEVATLIPKPDLEKIVGGMRVQDVSNWKTIRSVITPDIMATTKQVDFKVVKKENEPFSLILVPLQDYKGQQIGIIVFTKSLKYLEEIKASLFWNNIFLALAQALVITGAASVLFNGLLMRPILALGNRIKMLSQAVDTIDLVDGSFDELSSRVDEIGQIAKDCQILQNSTINTRLLNASSK